MVGRYSPLTAQPGYLPTTSGNGQVSMDMLQSCLSCDKHCDSKDNRFKMVVATKQAVLCFSREMFVHKNNIKIVEGTGTSKKSSETSDKISPRSLNPASVSNRNK